MFQPRFALLVDSHGGSEDGVGHECKLAGGGELKVLLPLVVVVCFLVVD